jgi:hypothetical protein
MSGPNGPREPKGTGVASTPREPKGAAPPGLRSDEGATREKREGEVGGASRAPGDERDKRSERDKQGAIPAVLRRFGGLTGLRLAGLAVLLAGAVAFPVLFPSPVMTN